jgi:hypothetical protein
MKRLTPFLYLCLMAFAAVVPTYAADPQAAPMPSQKSLYQRLGGYDALAAVTDDFITHLATDPQLGRFFTGLSADSRSGYASTSSIFCVSRPAARASTPGVT